MIEGTDADAALSLLTQQFLSSVRTGDSDAGFDLATLFLGEVPTQRIDLILAVAEALILQSAQLGSIAAQAYLRDTWPQMEQVLRGRFARRGLLE
jgi:hypothetical protein